MQTATTLLDGRILLAGGFDGSGYVTGAEIYDATSGRFSGTGSLHVGRVNATATRLTDGRVLIAGGDQGTGGEGGGAARIFSSAEVYDPATGKFATTGAMTHRRTNAAATLLTSGQVLVAGGYDDPIGGLATAELYDPVTGHWSKTGSMAVVRSSFSATLLDNGNALVVGGTVNSPGAELYDSATGKFSATGSIIYYDAAVRLLDGRLFLPGVPSELYWP
jgi:N-acetylneuraminic acid mutarotase